MPSVPTGPRRRLRRWRTPQTAPSAEFPGSGPHARPTSGFGEGAAQAPVCALVFLLTILSCMHVFWGALVRAAQCQERFCQESRDLRRGIEPPKSSAHLSRAAVTHAALGAGAVSTARTRA